MKSSNTTTCQPLVAVPVVAELRPERWVGSTSRMPEQIRAAELTADHLGRRVRIDPGDQTVVVARLVRVRHKQVGFAASPGY